MLHLFDTNTVNSVILTNILIYNKNMQFILWMTKLNFADLVIKIFSA